MGQDMLGWASALSSQTSAHAALGFVWQCGGFALHICFSSSGGMLPGTCWLACHNVVSTTGNPCRPKHTSLFVCRFYRVGTVVMLLHDANDVLMEAAKLAKYRNREDLATGFFASFTVAWLLLRLVCYPLLVIRSTLFEFPKVIDTSATVYYMFNALLCMLLVLHVYWFTLILRIVWIALATGSSRDVREDDDDS